MASTDGKVLGIDELSVYDALIKHYINLQYPSVSGNQIDDLFPQEPNVPDPIPTVELASWSTGTDEEITNIINRYYNGDLTLEEIQEAWHIGDVRNINIDAINATGSGWNVGESHVAQTVGIQIIGFNHDSLDIVEQQKTRALLTVKLNECLKNNNVIEEGYMNSEATNSGKWDSSSRCHWCNTGFYYALPSYIRNLIKTVVKANGPDASSDLSYDKVFLLSAVEILGTGRNSADYKSSFVYDDEGQRYELYADIEPYSYPLDDIIEWTRTASRADVWCFVDSHGGRANADTNYGIAPAFCL